MDDAFEMAREAIGEIHVWIGQIRKLVQFFPCPSNQFLSWITSFNPWDIGNKRQINRQSKVHYSEWNMARKAYGLVGFHHHFICHPR